jgi:hypothetical protein
MKLRKAAALFAAIASIALATAPIAGASGDKDSSDFPTQRAAQKWFKKHNPRLDPSGLDADHDGIACEDSP